MTSQNHRNQLKGDTLMPTDGSNKHVKSYKIGGFKNVN